MGGSSHVPPGTQFPDRDIWHEDGTYVRPTRTLSVTRSPLSHAFSIPGRPAGPHVMLAHVSRGPSWLRQPLLAFDDLDSDELSAKGPLGGRCL